MNAKSAEAHLFGYRRGRANEPAVEKALKLTSLDSVLGQRIEDQVVFDDQILRAIQAIAPPEGLQQQLSSGQKRSVVKGRPFAIPMLLAAICGIAVLLGLLVFFEMERRERYPGSDSVARMVATAKNMNGVELERVSNKAGQLGDWFYMRGFEAYAIPPELAEAPAVGARIFKQDGNSIAQVAVDWHDSFIYTFRADEFGVILPEDGDWRLRQDDDWAAALRKRGGICTLVAFCGTSADMRTFLANLEKK